MPIGHREMTGVVCDADQSKTREPIGLFGLAGHVKKLAETPGFEPGEPHSGLDGLANRWFQPLTHVSARIACRLGGQWLGRGYSDGLLAWQRVCHSYFAGIPPMRIRSGAESTQIGVRSLAFQLESR